MDQVPIGARIATARIARDLSQQSLATSAGIATRTLARIEAGADMNTKTLRLVASALGLPVAALLSPEPSEQAS